MEVGRNQWSGWKSDSELEILYDGPNRSNAPPGPDTSIHSVEAGIQGHGQTPIMIPTGPLPPAGNGEPPTGESIPVVMLTENAEMSLSTLFATYKNPPFASSATPKGCDPSGSPDWGISLRSPS